ncbi:DMT family transporter [Bacillus sp. T33-2]|uniref:DMT family transporter n=1 Tax=Bacillus sp. T33-2 TaxID=2054168 RepID=UPI000C761A25|nr:DMT family transporter [Bacillus sp. T33-2]PLR96833.1 EamA family transporter [Bacillus sp. T33-2]
MENRTAILANQRAKGMILVLTGASFWGISGTVAQYLFHEQHFSADWLVVARLLSAGMIMLLISHVSGGQNIWGIWKDTRDRVSLLIFGVAGMLGVQYTYFAAIEEGNAAAATVLQYLAPIIITCFLCLRSKQLPARHVVTAVVLALVGTFLLVTGGSSETLAIPGSAVFWGISSAFALAFYTLQPARLLARWGSFLTVGWGMMIGGIGFSFITPPWQLAGQWSLSSVLAIAFVIIFGTLIAFYCYMEALKHINASETSLLASVEPLSAACLSVVWLHVPFGPAEWTGTLFIISTIFILSVPKK